MTFGEVVQLYLKELGITQTELAKRAGYNKQTINALIKESGEKSGKTHLFTCDYSKTEYQKHAQFCPVLPYGSVWFRMPKMHIPFVARKRKPLPRREGAIYRVSGAKKGEENPLAAPVVALAPRHAFFLVRHEYRCREGHCRYFSDVGSLCSGMRRPSAAFNSS